MSSFILYFSGHGMSKGDWLLPDESFIKLKEVLQEWSESQSHQTHRDLLIVSDSCNSGAWVKALNRYHQRREYRNVDMVAACLSNDFTLMSTRSGGSDFTKALCLNHQRYNRIPTCTHSLQLSKRRSWLPFTYKYR